MLACILGSGPLLQICDFSGGGVRHLDPPMVHIVYRQIKINVDKVYDTKLKLTTNIYVHTQTKHFVDSYKLRSCN